MFDFHPGAVLPNGATVLSSKVSLTVCTRYVLAKTGGYHPYVVWSATEDGQTYTGRYYQDLDEAMEKFITLVGN